MNRPTPRVVAPLFALAFAFACAASAQPENPRGIPAAPEVCAEAQVIPGLPFATGFDNTAAAPGAPTGLCNSLEATVMQNDVWFVLDATVTGVVTIDLDAPGYDAIVQVYSGPDCEHLAYSTCGDQPEPIVASFVTEPGGRYWIQVGDWGVIEGGGVTLMELTAAPLCPGDANLDGTVDFNDIAIILANWLFDYRPGTGEGDANLDGVVNFDDIAAVLAEWLSSCT